MHTHISHCHSKPHVVIFYKFKNSGSGPHSYHSHTLNGGLANNALNSVKVLKQMDIGSEVIAIKDYEDLKRQLFTITLLGHRPSHVIIEGAWVSKAQMSELANENDGIKFVERLHSSLGFLASEPEAITLLRDVISLCNPYAVISSNNQEFSNSLSEIYGKVLFLPNLYNLEGHKDHHSHHGNTLRIASYGASRHLKFIPNACLAAIQIAKKLNKNLEFYVNIDNTPGGESVRKTVRNLTKNLDWVKLIEVNWQNSDEFQKTVSKLNLGICLSSTESMCLIVADHIKAGVPVVVGPAIDWLDSKYQARIDETSEVAELGVKVIQNSHCVVKDQKRSLIKYIEDAKDVWRDYLELPTGRKGWLELFR